MMACVIRKLDRLPIGLHSSKELGGRGSVGEWVSEWEAGGWTRMENSFVTFQSLLSFSL